MRYWKCQKCGTRWPRTKQVCQCGRRRPAPRKAAHLRALESPYEEWVERFGEACGICGRKASETRRLDRDHCHQSGKPRGLLCHRCNRALPNWADVQWLRWATEYLEKAS